LFSWLSLQVFKLIQKLFFFLNLILILIKHIIYKQNKKKLFLELQAHRPEQDRENLIEQQLVVKKLVIDSVTFFNFKIFFLLNVLSNHMHEYSVKVALVKQALVKQALVNQDLANQDLVNQDLVNQGLVSHKMVFFFKV